MIYVIGPGHGGPGLVAHSYLDGSYTERYPNIERSRADATAISAVLVALWHPKPCCAGNTQDRSMKVASWVIPWSMLMAQHSTTRT